MMSTARYAKKRCSVEMCESNTRTAGISLHRFPLDSQRDDTWRHFQQKLSRFSSFAWFSWLMPLRWLYPPARHSTTTVETQPPGFTRRQSEWLPISHYPARISFSRPWLPTTLGSGNRGRHVIHVKRVYKSPPDPPPSWGTTLPLELSCKLPVCYRGPAPRSESRATQVSPETLAADLRAPAPRQGQQQLPPAPGGGTRAAPPSKDRPAAAAPSPSPRFPPREERASRSCSVERVPLLKEQHGTHAAPVKGGVETNLGEPSPSSSATPPSGRGRGFPPRVPGRTSSVILHPSDTSQDMEIPTDADSQSTPGSDQDSMEWETASRKSKKKQPVVAPK
ncbi:hypothetical protein ISCGN_014369 [Ixodes scapularis]